MKKVDIELCYQIKDDAGVFILPMDFQQFRKICDIEEFYLMLEDKPKIALLCMSAAIHKVQNNSGWKFIELLSQDRKSTL